MRYVLRERGRPVRSFIGDSLKRPVILANDDPSSSAIPMVSASSSATVSSMLSAYWSRIDEMWSKDVTRPRNIRRATDCLMTGGSTGDVSTQRIRSAGPDSVRLYSVLSGLSLCSTLRAVTRLSLSSRRSSR